MPTPSPISRRLVPWLALSGLTLLAFLVMTPFLSPLAWAGVLAYASWPVAQWLRKKCGGGDSLAAGLMTALVALTLFLPLFWLGWLAQQEVSRLYPLFQEFVTLPPPVPDWLRGVPGLSDWLSQKRELLLADPHSVIAAGKIWLKAHSSQAAALVGGLGRNLVKLVLVVLILFFFYRDGTRIMLELRHVLERYLGARAHGYLKAVADTNRAVVYGVLLTALVQGSLAGAGYWVAGLDSPVTLGTMTALFALIPFGTPLLWGGAGLWLLSQGKVGAALGMWAWGALVVSQADNLLRPLFISSVSAIPFLLVLFGVLGGILAFGLVGLFVGPIVLAVVWAVWREWAAHLDDIDVTEN
ncbi:AI-2E family transporter [Trichloromonas sp.]|uniref:AI-2E family transporter n=1 Tax=Trichloromonas sp. TaxID=3069249 RepID=UPI002A4793D7|nr:AI-2E family transporter [Trichloromonas sp.]